MAERLTLVELVILAVKNCPALCFAFTNRGGQSEMQEVQSSMDIINGA